ncbi:hypothetical protein C8F01DRAFT_1170681 [Mycena amicta]|nr:hypothetical protein C8F01DRAFT_1170681 [Mycena amicta]
MSSTKNIWVAAGDGDLARVQHLIEHECKLQFLALPNNPHTVQPSRQMHPMSTPTRQCTSLNVYYNQFILTASKACCSFLRPAPRPRVPHRQRCLLYPSFTLNQFQGGDVNLEDGDRDTPLYTVENIETARFLVAHGATIDHRNSEGVSPIEHLQDEFSDVASYLHSVASPSSLPLPVFQQPSQRSQNLASEELTSALMASVAEILQRAEEEGRDPDEELKALVGETIMEGLELGYNMSEMIEEERRDEMDPTPTKRAKN